MAGLDRVLLICPSGRFRTLSFVKSDVSIALSRYCRWFTTARDADHEFEPKTFLAKVDAAHLNQSVRQLFQAPCCR